MTNQPDTPVLKAIFFDIDDTLYSTTEFARTARRNSIKAMIRAGLRIDEEDCFQELKQVVAEFGSNFEHHYNKLLLRIPRECYAGKNPAVIIAAAVVAYHDNTKIDIESYAYKDVPEVLEILKQRGLILGVITDGLEIKQAEKLIRLNLLDYFDSQEIFITSQIGIGKTNVKIYQRACQSLNLPPSSCMYVGDNPINDIDPPNQIGMITVRSRRLGGKHYHVTGKTEPRHVINNMRGLLDILRRDYNINMPSNP